jgi:hypothetical protein
MGFVKMFARIFTTHFLKFFSLYFKILHAYFTIRKYAIV